MRQVTLNSGDPVHILEAGQIHEKKVYRVLNSRQILTRDASEFRAWTYGETFFLDRETAVRYLKEKRMQGMKVILLEREISKLEDEVNRLRWTERKRRKQAIAAMQRKAEKPKVPIPQPAGYKKASTCDACGMPISSTGHCGCC